jgi:hypothetical protein
VYKLFGKRWALLAGIYPFLIFLGTVYTGEHYAIDEIIGIVYAVVAFLAVRWIFNNKSLHQKVKAYWQEQSQLW